MSGAVERLQGLVGTELGVSGRHLVSQAKIDRFADVTSDRQFIELDRPLAQAAGS